MDLIKEGAYLCSVKIGKFLCSNQQYTVNKKILQIPTPGALRCMW